MKKCLRCGKEMTENFKIGANGTRITEAGMAQTPLAEPKCAVCPACGYAELYVEDPQKFQKAADNRE